MRPVDSDALREIARALGLSGSGEPRTELEDGRLQQCLGANELIRRGRTFGNTQGLFTFVLTNVHPGADSKSTVITPYAVGATGLIAPFVSPVPRGFDLWLLNAVLRRTAGAGGLTTAILTVQFFVQGFGINDSGVAVVAQLAQPVALWDALVTEDITFGVLNGDRGPFAKIGLRLPRDASMAIDFKSTSAAAATFACQMTIGMFPVALGQDGIV